MLYTTFAFYPYRSYHALFVCFHSLIVYVYVSFLETTLKSHASLASTSCLALSGEGIAIPAPEPELVLSNPRKSLLNSLSDSF